ncbi:hypothetical protein ACFQE8_01270 [Salinirubellus sp. GCM10025818]|uniref:hypothetical protein n=1 Tax=Salinirubellus TaxID=2162630 RepID=UPI0030D42ED4
MATVIPEEFRDGDRAQLMLVGGLALAVTIVVLALVLNSAIYTHNLASRSDSAASESLTLDEDTRRGVGGIMDSVNSEGTGDDFPGLVSDYDTALGSWESSTRNLTGSNGRAVSVTGASEREGVRIVDDDGGAFHPASGTPSSWTVVKEVRVRRFEMEVTDTNLLSTNLALLATDSPFNVTFHDPGTGDIQHRVSIYKDTAKGTINVTVDEKDESTLGTCSISRSDAVIDFTDAEVETGECEPLGFLSEYDEPYDIRFHNSGDSTGAYELTVDRVIDDSSSEAGSFTDAVDTTNFGNHCSGPTYNGPGGSSPFVAPAIYSTEIDTEFVGSDTIVRGKHRIAPGEPGSEPATPRVIDLDVTDNSDGTDAIFDVSWTATDPDGNFQSVDVELEGATANSPETTTSGTVTRTVSGGDGNTYTVVVTVEDADGNTRTVRQGHLADGDGTGDDTCPE